MMEPRSDTNTKPCPHYPDCAGCSLIGTPYGEQLKLKRQRLVRALELYGHLGCLPVPQVAGAPRAFGYRNQAKLVVRRARRALLLGIYRPGTHRVVDISECPVHHPLINQILAAVRAEIERRDVPVYDERDASGWLRYVVVRVSGWQRCAQVILIGNTDRWSGMRPLARALNRVRGVRGVVLNVNPTPGNVIFGAHAHLLAGEDGLIERIGSLKLSSRAGSFLQANIATARRVYQRVLEWAALEPGQTAVDLYCGVGAISFCLASCAGSVWGIEESPPAVLDAKRNVRLNGVHNVRFIGGEAAPCMRELAKRLEWIDVVTLNPPRKGADESTREAIVQVAPRRIVYVSCEPTTLARDLDWFAAHQYRPTAVQPFDMLPQTEHVETVALLLRSR